MLRFLSVLHLLRKEPKDEIFRIRKLLILRLKYLIPLVEYFTPYKTS